ncbi:hypothetical protein SFRA_012100 [Streptomyces xinghaiensis]|uniref:Uncharacterized protein n=1 Tax=Streptomyces xinghaiensis TaxID=1038928 RepID=A0A420V4D8_9ACTN|nr:hypothetical protein SFRA_012100 [Streptomyces xinghaiensis]RNC70930.1 hypothetical protein DC095_023875 [Streptomyces xinghaiensis]
MVCQSVAGEPATRRPAARRDHGGSSRRGEAGRGGRAGRPARAVGAGGAARGVMSLGHAGASGRR